MDSKSLAQHAFERAQRGLEAWREGAVGHHAGRWFVAGSRGEIRRVDLRDESCDCPDFRRHGEPCKHVYAVAAARSKMRRCDGCGWLFPRRELVEVHPETHDGMAAFDGDRLCGRCRDRLGVGR